MKQFFGGGGGQFSWGTFFLAGLFPGGIFPGEIFLGGLISGELYPGAFIRTPLFIKGCCVLYPKIFTSNIFIKPKLPGIPELKQLNWKTPVLESHFNKVAAVQPAFLFKRDSTTYIFLWILQNF